MRSSARTYPSFSNKAAEIAGRGAVVRVISALSPYCVTVLPAGDVEGARKESREKPFANSTAWASLRAAEYKRCAR